MLNLRTRTIALCSLGALVWATAQAGQRQAKASVLSAMDQIEIQQLVAQANYALSTGADNGYMYAADGVFGRPYTTGHDELVALAHTPPHDRQYIRHFLTNRSLSLHPKAPQGDNTWS
jgi:hypothetical protein